MEKTKIQATVCDNPLPANSKESLYYYMNKPIITSDACEIICQVQQNSR